MSRNTKLDVFWPPRGWGKLSFVKNLKAQSIVKDPVRATIMGLHYRIEPVPTYLRNGGKTYNYNLSIYGWNYTIQNESHEYSVLSFDFSERFDSAEPRENFISNIRVKSRPLLINERSASRTLTAAIFLIKQIKSGKVPDCDRVLRLYKIHPSQRSLYEIEPRVKSKLKYFQHSLSKKEDHCY